MSQNNLARLRQYVRAMTTLVNDSKGMEATLLAQGEPLLKDLIQHDDWLPEVYAQPHPQYYQQYLLYCDPLERFSVVSFVWGPGQKTPIHDHQVWGLLGVLRGAERAQRFEVNLVSHSLLGLPEEILKQGQIDTVSPTVGDIHQVANAYADETSISIHVYGANIGAVKRHVFDIQTGQAKDFVSGYSNANLPNLWDRSEEIRQSL